MSTKVSREDVESKIVNEEFLVSSSKKKTVCILTLENGFEAMGSAGVVDPANYDKAKGEEISRQNAFNKAWELEGYLLQQKLHEAKA